MKNLLDAKNIMCLLSTLITQLFIFTLTLTEMERNGVRDKVFKTQAHTRCEPEVNIYKGHCDSFPKSIFSSLDNSPYNF